MEMRATAGRRSRFLRPIKYLGIAVLILFAAIIGVLVIKWPFNRGAATQSLETVSASDVTIESFQEKFWPHPGYIANGVSFRRGGPSNFPPLARVERATCQGS